MKTLIHLRRRGAAETVPVPRWDAPELPADVFCSLEFRQLLPVDLNFNDHWQLAGLKFREENGVFTAGFRWRCLRRYAGWVRCFAHILDASGTQIGSLDHDLLDGTPPPAEWRPGDEGYEIRKLDLSSAKLRRAWISLGSNGYKVVKEGGADPVFQLRLGLFTPCIGLRLPLRASSLPLTDNCTAALIEANAVPGERCIFRCEPAPLVPCKVAFGDCIDLVGYSVTKGAGVIWVRLSWRVRRNSDVPLRFFGHGIPERYARAGSLSSFDQEMGLEGRGSRPSFEQDVVRSAPPGGPEPCFLRGGVCASQGLQRLPIGESSLDCDAEQRCFFIAM